MIVRKLMARKSSHPAERTQRVNWLVACSRAAFKTVIPRQEQSSGVIYSTPFAACI